MKSIVVDASVAAKWFLPEPQAEIALNLLDGKHNLMAPDLFQIEFGNIVWKCHQRNLLSADELTEIVRQFLLLPVEIYASESFVSFAVELAVTTGRTVYDSLYLALAIKQDAVFVTADERFANAIKTGPFAKHVRLLGKRK